MSDSIPDPAVHVLPLDVTLHGDAARIHPVAVETARGLVLVDAGLPDVDALAARLDDAGLAVEDVALLLVTHEDPDHAGGAAAVAERSGATVLAHAGDAPAIDGRRALRGVGLLEERYPPVRVDVELGGPATLPTRAGPARVLETPGHTPGHVSVHLPEAGLLVAGDALVVEDGRPAGPMPGAAADLERALDSAAALADLSFERLVAYHGGPAVADGAAVAAAVERA